jgi:hypothetical protein
VTGRGLRPIISKKKRRHRLRREASEAPPFALFCDRVSSRPLAGKFIAVTFGTIRKLFKGRGRVGKKEQVLVLASLRLSERDKTSPHTYLTA